MISFCEFHNNGAPAGWAYYLGGELIFPEQIYPKELVEAMQKVMGEKPEIDQGLVRVNNGAATITWARYTQDQLEERVEEGDLDEATLELIESGRRMIN